MRDNYNNIFLAIPKAVVEYGEIKAYSNEHNKVYNTTLSEPLGFFLVRPIKRFKVFHDYYAGSVLSLATVGFAEIKTGKRIITRTFSDDEQGYTRAVQHDVLADVTPSNGDIQWSVDECPTVLQKMDQNTIKDYMKLSKKEIVSRLNNIHIEAQELAASEEPAKVKQKI